MRRWMSLFSAIIFSLASVAPVQGATIIDYGAYDGTGWTTNSGGLALDSGRYRFSLAFTGPVQDVFGYVEKNTVASFYCDEGEGEFYCGGDTVPTNPLFEMVSPTLYQLSLTVNAPGTYLSPGHFTVRTDQFDVCCSYAFDFSSDASGTYTLSYATVPEPETWALMLIGFGAVGSALRRSRAQKAAPITS